MGELTEPRLRRWMRAGQQLSGKSDGGGLTFTLSRGGTATWVLRYRLAGKQREVTLGNYPDVSLAAAREFARAARVKVDQGIDVAAEKRKTKLDAARANTFRQLADDYMLRAAPALAQISSKEIRRYLDKDILRRIGHLPAAEITGSDIVAMVERIAERSDSVARLAFTFVSMIFGHGIARHFVKSNPTAGLKVSAILGPPPAKRERIMLTEAEIGILMERLPTLGKINALTIKIILATAVRKGEFLQATWAEIDFDAATWTIPPGHTKTGQGIVIPLAPIVVDWFTELKTVTAGDKGWIFRGNKSTAHGAALDRSGRSRCSGSLNAALERLDYTNLRRFTPHDLRSSARSYLTSRHVGASVVVAEKCLNHSLGGLLAIYDQNDYMPERRLALERWAAFIVQAEAGKASNVTALPMAA